MMSEYILSEKGEREFIHRDDEDQDLDLQLDADGELYVRNPYGGKAHALRVIATRKLGRELKWAEVVLQLGRDPLDVRRCNLVVVLVHGRHRPKVNKQKYKGVVWDDKESCWRVEIQLPDQEKYCEYFDSEVEAADARDEVLAQFGVK